MEAGQAEEQQLRVEDIEIEGFRTRMHPATLAKLTGGGKSKDDKLLQALQKLLAASDDDDDETVESARSAQSASGGIVDKIRQIVTDAENGKPFARNSILE